MEHRNLSTSDLKVSKICLGSMTWGQQNTESEGHQQISFALDQGVNFIDTAELYAVPPSADSQGKTEEIIGSWFSKTKKRHEIVLASKVVGAARTLPWIREGKARLDKENIISAVDSSLKRLNTDYIDLYQLHWPNRVTYHFGKNDVDFSRNEKKRELASFAETLNTLSELIKAGKIRYWGLSNETAWGTMSYLGICEASGISKPVSIQNEYSLLCRYFEKDLEEVSIVENIPLLAWSPLAAGALSGKYLDGKVPDGSRRSLLKNHVHRQTPEADEAIKAYHEIAKAYSLDPCQLAIAFCLSKAFMGSVIIGATNMEQLATNIKAAETLLPESCLKDIEIVYRKFGRVY